MKTLIAFVLLLATPALAQVNEKAFQARGDANRAACDVISRTVSVDHPLKAKDAIATAKEKCIQEREVKQHLQKMGGCRKEAKFKECMNSAGYDVVE
jgi:hypothetical protein